MKNDQQELILIAEYQKKFNPQIELFFYENYHHHLAEIIYRYIKNKFFFSYFFIEKQDLYAFIWWGIKAALNNYVLDKKSSFFSYLVVITTGITIRYLNHYGNTGHRILNMIEMSQIQETNQIGQTHILTKNNYIDDDHLIFCSLLEHLVRKINSSARSFCRKIILLRDQGYCPEEIQAKLQITKWKYRYFMRLIKKTFLRYKCLIFC